MYSLDELKSMVETDVKELVLPASPARLYEPVRYILSAGGKRVRPVSVLMSCNIFGDDLSSSRKVAMAVEVFHNFTLLHDDIMDNASVRRGSPTVHKKWDENVAILSGDAMMILAYKLLAESGKLPLMIDIFNRFAIEVCEGQQYDMDYESRNDVSVGEYLKMIEYKTGVLLAGGLQMGALCGGATVQQAKIMYDFGIDIGLAFQLQDDILDIYADEKVFGKAIGGDIVAGKKTFLLTTALERSDDTQRSRLMSLIEDKTMPREAKVAEVKAIYDTLKIRSITESAVEVYFKRALGLLSDLKVDESRLSVIRSWAHELLNRKS